MNYNDAKKLQVNDQVKIKSTGEIATIYAISRSKKSIFFECNTQDGYKDFGHREVQ